jgi:stage V sporulation protein S
MEIIKVSAKSRSTAVAGAIAGVVREEKRAEAQAIGAGAVNQAVKAVAIARGYLALDGIDVICIPAFTEVEIDGQERTAIKLIVEPRWSVLLILRFKGHFQEIAQQSQKQLNPWKSWMLALAGEFF